MTEWVEISDQASFDQLVTRAATPVLVAFETDDCGYCRPKRQLLTRAWRQLDWSVLTLRVDAQRSPAIAHTHRILVYPTLAVFVDGWAAQRYPGRRDAVDLTRRLDFIFGGAGAEVRPTSRRTPRPAAPPAQDPAAVASSRGGTR